MSFLAWTVASRSSRERGGGLGPGLPAGSTRPGPELPCSTATLSRLVPPQPSWAALLWKATFVIRSRSPAAIDQAEKELGAISILVNNAGITGRTDQSWNLHPDEVRQVLEVNVMGPFLFCKTLVPRLIDRGYGRIVNVASIAGKEGNPTLLPYSASKAAVIALTKSLAKELAGKGDITVNAISPAVIKTAILEGVAPVDGRVHDLEDTARANRHDRRSRRAGPLPGELRSKFHDRTML